MQKTFKALETWILYAIIFLVPVLVLPIFPNAYITPKLAVLTWGLGIILLIKAVRTFMRGSVRMSLSSYDVPVIFLAVSYVLGIISRSPNKMEALLLPGTGTAMIAAILLYFVINQFDEERKSALRVPLLLAGAVVSIFSLFAVAGVFKGISNFPAFMKEPSFTLLEGVLPTLMFLVALLPTSIQMLVTEKDMARKALFGTITAIIVFGGIISLFHALPGKSSSPNLPNFQTSWVVAVDTLKESPLLGAGPGNYLSSFNRFRPINYNQTDLWPIRFNSARSFYLNIVTEAGILGATGLILLIAKLLQIGRGFKKSHTEEGILTDRMSSLISFLILAAFLIIFPATTSITVIFFTLLALSTRTQKTKLDVLSTKEEQHVEEAAGRPSWIAKLPIILTTAPMVIFVIAFMVLSSRVLVAEYHYRKALEAVVANDGRQAYDLMRKTIAINPYVDRYRSTYSQINLSLANAIAGNKDLSESDRQIVAQLIQQAIREGKASVILNSGRANNWELLSSVYRAIIPLAKGADQFSVQTMRQAVILDPINPNLRIQLGGIFYQLKAYDAAIESFRLAVASKPDLANAHYNLAIAYREKGEYQRAASEMNAVLTLVKKDSKDYELAKTELENIEKKLPAKPAKDGETLDAPSQEPDKLNPKLDLPADSNPPAGEEAPEPTPVATVRPTVAPSATPDTP